jgi:threonine/homoserine/homoserine lactone efflux protein
MGSLAPFLGIAALVIVTPGPDTALTVRNTLVGGRRAGVLTAVGVAAGQATWTLASCAGLAALLVASEPAFVALKLVGAAYLILLGLQALRSGLFPGAAERPGAAPIAGRRVSPASALRHGLVSNLGNPKMAVFFTSLLPQFAPAGETSFAALLALGLVFCGMTLAWLTAYAAAVARAGDVLGRPGVRRVLEGVMGGVLIALGLRLAAARR